MNEIQERRTQILRRKWRGFYRAWRLAYKQDKHPIKDGAFTAFLDMGVPWEWCYPLTTGDPLYGDWFVRIIRYHKKTGKSIQYWRNKIRYLDNKYR